LNPIEIAIDVKLQQPRWMIWRPASGLGSHPVKSRVIDAFVDKLDLSKLYRSGLIETSASASSGHRRIDKTMALAGQLLVRRRRPNRELKLRGRLHRRGHATGVLGWWRGGGFPFPHAVVTQPPEGGLPGLFSSPPPSRGGRVMIEFILIVVALLLLIGIFVRREVFKW
jgi:hypothetical protein